MQPYRGRLNPDLVAAVRSSPIPKKILAHSAGFPAQSSFSALLHAPEVVVTELTMTRLRAVARLVNFRGNLFTTPERSKPRERVAEGAGR